MHRNICASKISEYLKLKSIGPDLIIDGLNLCNRKSEQMHILTYVTNANYVDVVKNNSAVVGIVLREEDIFAYKELTDERELFFIVSEEPERTFYDIHDYLYYEAEFYDKYEFETIIGDDCVIHPSAVIDNGVIIGNRVTIGANSVIRRGTVLKDGCTIGCNSTIGSEGFQILRMGKKNRKVVHCGGVLISEDAFVGDNTAVCNALFEGHTYIGKNAVVDNLVHVAHNLYVGDDVVVTAGTILCGSSNLEDGAWIGVNSSILNRVTIGSYAKVGIGSVVTKDIPQESLAYGVPARVK